MAEAPGAPKLSPIWSILTKLRCLNGTWRYHRWQTWTNCWLKMLTKKQNPFFPLPASFWRWVGTCPCPACSWTTGWPFIASVSLTILTWGKQSRRSWPLKKNILNIVFREDKFSCDGGRMAAVGSNLLGFDSCPHLFLFRENHSKLLPEENCIEKLWVSA